MLREIGLQLDQNIFPLVENGGIVTPSETASPPLILGKENGYAKPTRQNRPKTRPWTRATRWQGQTRELGTTCTAPPVICSSLQQKYTAELDAVNNAYPGTQFWQQEEGIWLLSHSALLPDIQHNAVFLCAIPFVPTIRVRCWGFWNGHTWIGPRHTNMPDGSICAFEPSDGTWVPGDSIIKLLDIYSLWAVRHLHLQAFNRWPGAQVAHFAFERLTELKEDELCGCGSLNKQYGECCRPIDLKRNQVADAIEFISLGGTERQPPEAVKYFMKEQDNPPSILEL